VKKNASKFSLRVLFKYHVGSY